jgi:hypothetical protein
VLLTDLNQEERFVTMMARYLLVNSTLSSGFGLVTLFGLTGVIASLALIQQGIDISPAGMV